jgi:hypothetical protein
MDLDNLKFNEFISGPIGSKTCLFLPGINFSSNLILSNLGYDRVNKNFA